MGQAIDKALLRILIADDVESIRHDLSILLNLAHDFQVVGEAANGKETLYAVGTLKPDVVLMDLEMPGLDGFDATLELKTRYPLIRVVVLTIYGDDGHRRRAIQAGADAFLVKGIRQDVLFAAVRGEKSDI
jgi:DNA-binding NarL/FixJ family response regulator